MMALGLTTTTVCSPCLGLALHCRGGEKSHRDSATALSVHPQLDCFELTASYVHPQLDCFELPPYPPSGCVAWLVRVTALYGLTEGGTPHAWSA